MKEFMEFAKAWIWEGMIKPLPKVVMEVVTTYEATVGVVGILLYGTLKILQRREQKKA